MIQQKWSSMKRNNFYIIFQSINISYRQSLDAEHMLWRRRTWWILKSQASGSVVHLASEKRRSKYMRILRWFTFRFIAVGAEGSTWLTWSIRRYIWKKQSMNNKVYSGKVTFEAALPFDEIVSLFTTHGGDHNLHNTHHFLSLILRERADEFLKMCSGWGR